RYESMCRPIRILLRRTPHSQEARTDLSGTESVYPIAPRIRRMNRPRGARRSDPACQLASREARHRIEPVGPVVEAGRQIQRLAPRAAELLPPEVADLVESFQTVGHESGTNHQHALHALRSEPRERLVGV